MGRKIAEAASKGHVQSEEFHRDPAPGYDGELRQMIAEHVWGVWNSERRPCRLSEIYEGVRARVQRRIEDGDWPKVWGYPIRRTCDRRCNEAADWRFYPDEPTPIIQVKPGWYQANPALFEESVKSDISDIHKESASRSDNTSGAHGEGLSEAQTGTGSPRPPALEAT